MSSKIIFPALAFLASSIPASADMTYRPVNPSFGGDTFNSSHLQALATIENQYKPKANAGETQSESERFLNMLESRLYSGLASQVSEAIFGENAQPSGTITFDDQTIQFNNNGTSIQLVVTDLNTGQVTNIVIPALAQ